MARRKTHAEFVKEMALKHPNIAVLGQYQNSNTKIMVRCKICDHAWMVLPSSLVNIGSGCPKCARKRVGNAARMDPQAFVERLRNVNPFITVIGLYQNSDTRVDVACNRCGHKWEARPAALLRGARCPACSHGHTSFMEQFIAEALRRQFGADEVKSPNRSLIGKELDIYIPSARLAIEPGSWFWHKDKVDRDLAKRELAHNKGVRLITIYDAFPESEAPPFQNDCWTYPFDLGSEPGHTTLRKLTESLIAIIDPLANQESVNWEEVEHVAILRSGMRSTEDFVSELLAIREDIEVLGNYQGSNAPIECRCTICGHEWSPTPHSLLSQQSGCPKCAGSLKKTTDQFKAELAEVNPDVEVLGEYANIQTPLECRCRKCGHIWSPRPLGLLNGTGCPNCYRMRPSPIKKESSQFLEELSALHPNIEVVGDYLGSAEKIQVRCKRCNYAWNPTANSLLSGHGCPKCAGSLKKTTEQFKEELAGINPNVEVLGTYVTSKTKIECQCKICGNEWRPTPNALLRGYGCPECAGTKKLDQSTFKGRVQSVSPSITVMGEYKNSRTKVECRCETCGYIWNVLPASLLSGHGCPKCAGKLKKTTEQFAQELAQVNPLIEVLGEYVTSKTKIRCKCKICSNEWSPTPNDLLRGRRCPRCHCKNQHIDKPSSVS